MTRRQQDGMAAFASADAEVALNRICRDPDERELMMTVFDQLSEIWESGGTLAGSLLAEAAVPVDRMLHAARGLAMRGVISGGEMAWLADQLTSAGADIEGDGDAELRRIRGRMRELRALRAEEDKRVLALKVAILRRCDEGRLAGLLEDDPAAFASMVEEGEPRATRRVGRWRAA